MLQVSWYPADDAERSSVNYLINTTLTGIMNINHPTSVDHPITTTTLNEVPLCSVGTVSVQAMNPGVLGEPVSVGVRMVDIVTNCRYAELVYSSFNNIVLSNRHNCTICLCIILYPVENVHNKLCML